MNDTIAAISSSGGPIGLIRVSGERAIEAINAVFQAKNGKPLMNIADDRAKGKSNYRQGPFFCENLEQINKKVRHTNRVPY